MRVSKPFAALIIVSVVNAILAVPAHAKSSSGTSLSATVTTTGHLLGNYSLGDREEREPWAQTVSNSETIQWTITAARNGRLAKRTRPACRLLEKTGWS